MGVLVRRSPEHITTRMTFLVFSKRAPGNITAQEIYVLQQEQMQTSAGHRRVSILISSYFFIAAYCDVNEMLPGKKKLCSTVSIEVNGIRRKSRDLPERLDEGYEWSKVWVR